MNPERPRNNNQTENKSWIPSLYDLFNKPKDQEQLERYNQLERGDTNQFHQSYNNQSNNNQSNQQSIQKNQISQKQDNDPVQIVTKLISMGFTPTRNQILNAQQYIHDSNDSADKWFAIFLQKLLNNANKKNKK